jgi:hypothetical protein
MDQSTQCRQRGDEINVRQHPSGCSAEICYITLGRRWVVVSDAARWHLGMVESMVLYMHAFQVWGNPGTEPFSAAKTWGRREAVEKWAKPTRYSLASSTGWSDEPRRRAVITSDAHLPFPLPSSTPVCRVNGSIGSSPEISRTTAAALKRCATALLTLKGFSCG